MEKDLIKIQIKNIYDNVIYEYECEDNTVKKTVENAVENGASLYGASLYGAKNLEPLYICDLYSIKMQDTETKLKFWKFVVNDKSPMQDEKITYPVGKTVKEKKCNKDEKEACFYRSGICS